MNQCGRHVNHSNTPPLYFLFVQLVTWYMTSRLLKDRTIKGYSLTYRLDIHCGTIRTCSHVIVHALFKTNKRRQYGHKLEIFIYPISLLQMKYYQQSFCSKVPIMRPPMVLVEKGRNNEQVSLMRLSYIENCILVLKPLVLIVMVVLISSGLYSGTLL